MNIKQTGPEGEVERIVNPSNPEEGSEFFTIEDVVKDVNNAISIEAIRNLFFHTTYFGDFQQAKIYENNLDEIISLLEKVRSLENESEKIAIYIRMGELIKELPSVTDLQKLTVNKIREVILLSMGLKVEKK